MLQSFKVTPQSHSPTILSLVGPLKQALSRSKRSLTWSVQASNFEWIPDKMSNPGPIDS